MKFSTREDMDVPLDALFALLTDFDYFERAALRRGAEVQRDDAMRQPGPGMAWKARFQFRGRERRVRVELTQMQAPELLSYKGGSKALEGRMQIELLALSRKRSRMNIALEITPRTLAARLMVQSMKLARANLTRRFEQRIAGFARNLEERHGQTVG